MARNCLVVNLDRCIGCHTCANACKMQNNVPDGMLWNRVITEGCDAIDGAVGEYPNLTRTYVPLACQHCENPACLKVCPTGATYKDEQGRVEIDYDRCIGCVWPPAPSTPACSTGKTLSVTAISTGATRAYPCAPAA